MIGAFQKAWKFITAQPRSLDALIGHEWIVIEAYCDDAGEPACYVRMRHKVTGEIAASFGNTIPDAADKALFPGLSYGRVLWPTTLVTQEEQP